MKHKLLSALLSVSMLVCALPAALASEPENLVIAPNPVISTDPTIAPKPADELTRSDAVTRLWVLAGQPVVTDAMHFQDVTPGSDAAEAIRWAASRGIAQGYGEKAFGADDPVTREQLSAMIYRYAQTLDLGFRGAWMFYLGCEDLSSVHEWAVEPMYWMVSSKLMDGSAPKLLPQARVTAPEADTIFAGFQALLQKA